MLWDDTAEKGLAFDELLGASELPTAVLEHLRALGYPAEAYEVDSVKLRALSASGFALQTSAQPIVGIIGESWYSAKDEQIFFAALYWCTTA